MQTEENVRQKLKDARIIHMYKRKGNCADSHRSIVHGGEDFGSCPVQSPSTS